MKYSTMHQIAKVAGSIDVVDARYPRDNKKEKIEGRPVSGDQQSQTQSNKPNQMKATLSKGGWRTSVAQLVWELCFSLVVMRLVGLVDVLFLCVCIAVVATLACITKYWVTITTIVSIDITLMIDSKIIGMR